MDSAVVETIESTQAGAPVRNPAATARRMSMSSDAVGWASAVPHLGRTQAGALGNAVRGRRRIPPVSGHALEKLGRAIEYLTDEYVHEGCEGGFSSCRVEAIQLLMSLNRDVYYECPLVPPMSRRIGDFLRRAIGD